MMRLAVAVAALALLGGCGAAGLVVASAGTGVAMSTGVEHSLSGTTYKTFSSSAGEVRQATLRSLKQMQIKVTEDAATETGWSIRGVAAERSITVELEKLTPVTTRMRVDVDRQGSIFWKDASTATEIMLQTAQTLDERPATTAARGTRRS